MPRKPKAINAKLIEYVPELSSHYVKYPMAHPRWLKPEEKSPDGEVCFLAATTNRGTKPNYVYGPGPSGYGYYHLLTHHSHMILYNRLRSQSPVTICSCNAAAYEKMDEFDDVKRIVWARVEARQPNDSYAYGQAMKTLADSENVKRGSHLLKYDFSDMSMASTIEPSSSSL